MSAIETAWLVGEFVLASNATVTVNATPKVIAAGRYYLRDSTAARSLVDKLADIIDDVVPGSTVTICKDRLLRIVSGGGALTLAIPASLQAVTGLAASPTVGTTVTADAISTLLWSPGWPETPTGNPTHADGFDVSDRTLLVSPTGLTASAVIHAEQRHASWSWQAVAAARVWTASDAGGEFHRFRDDVLMPARRFKLYTAISEDAASATAVSWSTAKGPYIARELPDDWYRRTVENTDAVGADIELAAIKTSEIP